MQDKLHANALDGAWLNGYPDIKVLSLDCFDTLLWRKVASPSDVFFSLAHSEPYRRTGLTALLRSNAETQARRIGRINVQSGEVTLEQIYRHALPAASQAEIDALAAAELACEREYCFVFKPVFDLIVQARQRGLKVIIVSDTYFSESQLRALLFGAVPALAGLIDAVYCSSMYRQSKTGGIFRKLVGLLKVAPDQVLHLGDNLTADFISPRRAGVRSVHFIQQRDGVADVLKSRSQVATQLLPELGYREPVPNYHHAQIAVGVHADQLAAFGYASLGPIMYGFAEFVLREAAALEAAGARLKIGFLLRDGFLPGKSCAALAGAPVGVELNISRLTAIAATLDSRERVVALLSKTLSAAAFEPLTRQLMLAPALAEKILKTVARSAQPERDYASLVLQDGTVKQIMAASRKARARLVRHVQKMTGVVSGDTLMLVDLGYSGTAQTLLKDVLKQDLNVELVGRYLLAEEVMPHQSDRKGLLDASEADARAVHALTGRYIAGFEMLCTQAAPSTVDYTEQGDPVFAATTVSADQQEKVARIQAACLRFIGDVAATAACFKPKAEPRQMGQSAAIDLARLLYFPTALELACMASFQFDFNLGTDMNMLLFDPAASVRAMRAQGFAYMNAELEDIRPGYAWELRALDLSLSALLFAQNRFGFDMQPASASYRKETLDLLVTNERSHSLQQVEASATYDGYFAALVPLSSKFNVGVLLGKSYSWVQIESVQLVADGELQGGVDMVHGQQVIFDQMAGAGNGLYQVQEGAMMYLPGLDGYGSNMICRLVFRPIAWINQS